MDKIISFGKGIRRQPSVGEDGELSELVNLIPKNGELVNVRGMEQYTNSTYEENLLVYIHAVQGTNNLILKPDDRHDLEYESGGVKYTIAEDVMDFRGITSVGNTLVVRDGGRTRYFLWKDDKYTELNISGAGFSMTIETDPSDEKMSAGICYNWLPYDTTVYPTPDSDNKLTFSPAQLRSIYLKSDAYVNERMSAMDKPEEWHKYVTFGIAALRLYDDTYITYSDIFTLDPQCSIIQSSINPAISMPNVTHNVQTVLSKYKVTVDAKAVDGQIVTGIDFYLTQPYSFIETDKDRTVILRIGTAPMTKEENLFMIMGEEKIREELSSMVFKKAYSINKYNLNSEGQYSFIIPKPSEAGKELNLADIHYSSFTSDRLMSYNGRLNLAGADVNFTPMRRVQCVQKAASPATFKDKQTGHSFWGGGYYGLVGNDNINDFVLESTAEIVIRVKLVDPEYGHVVDWYYEKEAYYPLPPVISYPSRYVEEIFVCMKYNNNIYSYIGEPQHMINGNLSLFFFGGYGYEEKYGWLREGLDDSAYADALEKAKNHSRRIGSASNTVKYSDYGNPFHFPAINSIQVGNESIVGVSTSAKALSQGQFGQFPLYVFCTDGIWALEVGSDGSYTSVTPVSRDVCNNPDSITQIDGAVVFTTDQGLMMIQGSEVVNLSGAMEGFNVDEKKYFPDGFFDSYDKGDFDDLVITETRDFREILKTCKIAYDYVNKMLRIFPIGENLKGKYYVFSLESREFATVYLPGWNGANINVVADYPSSIIQINNKLYRPSETDDNENTKNGLLLTRPIDMGEPFAMKKLQDMKLHYTKHNKKKETFVKMVVYVSNDGEHWYVLSSLRKRAYKYYRVALITKMTDNDALSGMIMRYELERTNKIR